MPAISDIGQLIISSSTHCDWRRRMINYGLENVGCYQLYNRTFSEKYSRVQTKYDRICRLLAMVFGEQSMPITKSCKPLMECDALWVPVCPVIGRTPLRVVAVNDQGQSIFNSNLCTMQWWWRPSRRYRNSRSSSSGAIRILRIIHNQIGCTTGCITDNIRHITHWPKPCGARWFEPVNDEPKRWYCDENLECRRGPSGALWCSSLHR